MSGAGKSVAHFDPMCNDRLPRTSVICLPKDCPRLFTHRLRHQGHLVRRLHRCVRGKKGLLTRKKKVTLLKRALATHPKNATCRVTKVLPCSIVIGSGHPYDKCHRVRCHSLYLGKCRCHCFSVVPARGTISLRAPIYGLGNKRMSKSFFFHCGGYVTAAMRRC